MTGSEALGIAGLVVGVGGIVIGLRQTLSARHAKQLYQEKCATRCKDILELVSSLSDEASAACETVNSDRVQEVMMGSSDTRSHACTLVAKTEGVMTLTNQLMRFCERLNEEYESEFKREVAPGFRERLQKLPCVHFFSRVAGSSRGEPQGDESPDDSQAQP